MRMDYDKVLNRAEDAHTNHEFHDDIQGVLGTALTGVTAYTPRAYRSTKMVFPHIARGDIFQMTFQLPHRRKLGTTMDSVHLHFIPLGANTGNLAFSLKWGWYGFNEVVPATLPNTVASVTVPLVAADQYKNKIASLATELAIPTSDGHSSILMVEVERLTTGDTWGAEEIALAYMDAHFKTDRIGSFSEAAEA